MEQKEIGVKETELRRYADCSICRQKIGASGVPLFYRVTVERFGVMLPAVRRQDGLGALIGSARLAQVMGTDEELTRPMMEPLILSICETCSTSHCLANSVAALAELPGIPP